MQNFYLTQLRDVFVISHPRSLALLWFFASSIESPFGDNFQYGPWGRNFCLLVFLRPVGKIEFLETGLFRGNL